MCARLIATSRGSTVPTHTSSTRGSSSARGSGCPQALRQACSENPDIARALQFPLTLPVGEGAEATEEPVDAPVNGELENLQLVRVRAIVQAVALFEAATRVVAKPVARARTHRLTHTGST